MGDTRFSSRDKGVDPFVELAFPEEAADLRAPGNDIGSLFALADSTFLPIFRSAGKYYALRSDLAAFSEISAQLSRARDSDYSGDLFRQAHLTSIPIEDATRIDLQDTEIVPTPVLYAALRNLIEVVAQNASDSQATRNVPYFPPARLSSGRPDVIRFAKDQVERARAIEQIAASRFAGSAHYMGSKRSLGAFLVEAVSGVHPEDGVVLDLMCGSGAASAAFSRLWSTWASDAQAFCCLLALIQGGGFDRVRAERILTQLQAVARTHSNMLRDQLGALLQEEDQLFHQDHTPDLIERYRDFVARIPTFPGGGSIREWNPVMEVQRRREGRDIAPYCLFSAYFVNLYFGLRQCVEIDSLRFAIDQLADHLEREWALGALVATVSAVSSNYGGHFAQPLVRTPGDINVLNIARLIERRTLSVTHEFAVRLMNLAGESERAPRAIHTLRGPWWHAIEEFRRKAPAGPVLVYLDAPYTRDEYSRYYHVLETLVVYSYPAGLGRGKVPDKARGERFSSEFFTKSSERVNQTFVDLISAVMALGWSCAWSYSSLGKADMVKVIRDVVARGGGTVRAYAARYEYKPQGGRKPRKATEYLVILGPDPQTTDDAARLFVGSGKVPAMRMDDEHA